MQPEHRYTISRHAIERFQQRVTPLSWATAHQAIEAIASTSRRRSRPRHWMRHLDDRDPDATYLYNHRIPDVCLIARDNVIVTVYTRTTCKKWQTDQPGPPSRRGKTRPTRRTASRRNPSLLNKRPIDVLTRKET